MEKAKQHASGGGSGGGDEYGGGGVEGSEEITIEALLEHVGIKPELVNYSVEEERFLD